MQARPLLGLLVVVLAGCAEPVGVRPPEVRRVHERGFRTEAAVPSDAPRAARSAGALDRTAPGAVLLLEGWVRSPDERVIVVTDPKAEVVSSRRVLRRDAAAAVGSVRADLGFKIILRTSSRRACVLSRARDGSVSVLAGSDPVWCPAR